jgi:hypothetical protein
MQTYEFDNASASFKRRNPHLFGGMASDTVLQPNPEYEPVAEDAREIVDQARRLVRITSFRLRLCDERNLWDKHFVDALVEAGIIFDDSPEFCQIEVKQEEVKDWRLERTEITIEPI